VQTYPGPPDPDAYSRVSKWLTNVAVNGKKSGLKPLITSKQYWDTVRREQLQWARSGSSVLLNLEKGFHDYGEVMELLHHSNPSRLVPILTWRNYVLLRKQEKQNSAKSS